MYNKSIVMGRLTADPELRQTPSGIPVTSFSIAVNRSFTNRQTGERQTDFLDIVAWRHTAEFVCRYFTKGNAILIEGSIQTRSYTDKDGQKRRVWEILADSAHFTGQSKAPAMVPAYVGGGDDFTEVDDDGDVPF